MSYAKVFVILYAVMAQMGCKKPADQQADSSLLGNQNSKADFFVKGMELGACNSKEIDDFLINSAIVAERRRGLPPLIPKQAQDFVKCMRKRDIEKERARFTTLRDYSRGQWEQMVDNIFGAFSPAGNAWSGPADEAIYSAAAIVSQCQADAGIQVGTVNVSWAMTVLGSRFFGDVLNDEPYRICLKGRLGKDASLVDKRPGPGKRYFIHIREPEIGSTLTLNLGQYSRAYVFNPDKGAKISYVGLSSSDQTSLFQQPKK